MTLLSLSSITVSLKEIVFYDDTATLVNSKGQKKTAKRQALDGLWIEYAWSVSNAALHVRINRVQIDNQLDYTTFPVTLYPIISKATGTDLGEHRWERHSDPLVLLLLVEKPFIELSVFESKTTRSNVMQFKYFKLLIQEFAVKIDQGLIVAILAFLKQEKVQRRLFSVTRFTVGDLLELSRPNDQHGRRFRTD